MGQFSDNQLSEARHYAFLNEGIAIALEVMLETEDGVPARNKMAVTALATVLSERCEVIARMLDPDPKIVLKLDLSAPPIRQAMVGS